MSMRSRSGKAFTLVELIIVVVILAILAAVIIPQFGDTSTEAKTSALKSTLQTVRAQLEVYKIQHQEKYPTRAKWEDAMTKKTTSDGTVDATNGKLGPYLMQMPVNPVDSKSTLAATQDGTGGWYYDEATGKFKSNDASVTGATSTTKDL